MNCNTHVTVKPHGNISNTGGLVPTHLHIKDIVGAATWLKPPPANGDTLTYGNGAVERGNARDNKDIVLITAWQATTDAWWMFVATLTSLTGAVEHDKLISMPEAEGEWNPRSVKRLWQLSAFTFLKCDVCCFWFLGLSGTPHTLLVACTQQRHKHVCNRVQNLFLFSQRTERNKTWWCIGAPINKCIEINE